MNTKTIAAIIMFIVAVQAVSAQEYIVHTGKSTLKWHGKKVTGEHYGNINLKEGKMTLEDEQITGGMFIIDMNSITNTDLANEAYNQKLVNHLKSDDFFGVEKHPEAILELLRSTSFLNSEATVDALLTIKDITHPITFVATRNGNVYHAEIVVDRSKYDVRYGSGSFFDNLGDKMIYDEFTINVEIHMDDQKSDS